MQPTIQPIPVIGGKLNGGKPLSPQQIEQMRSQAGVGSVSKPGSTPSASNVQDRITALRNGTYGKPVTPPSEGVVDKVKGFVGDVSSGVKKVAGNVVQSTKDIQKHSLDNVQKDVESVNPIKSGLGTVSDLAQFFLAPLSGLISGAVTSPENVEALSKTGPIKSVANSKVGDAIQQAQDKLNKIAEEHPDATKAIMDAINVAMIAAGGEKVPEAMDKFATGVKSDVGAIKGGIDNTVQGVKEAVASPLQAGEDLYQSTREHLSAQNVDPRLETSAERLSNPEETYSQFLEQEKKAKVDVKADSPLSTVGEKVGDSFDKVVKMRKDVGASMAEEMKKISDEPVNIAPAQEGFNKALGENDLTFDPKTGELRADGQSKMTSTDLDILSQYRKELSKLSNTNKISVKNVDAFVSRMAKELDLYKSKNNILSTTNAERIIKSSLHDMTEQFNPEISKNPAFEKYYKARGSYSKLTDFVDEGQKYLGNKTQTGDYARDVSLTKSSVQSLLNGGKKDWLAQLEGLTGYPALDESVMALQAMKDLGDARGESLLQTMTNGSIPTTKSGITQKILDWVMEKTKNAVVGSPEEQTKTFLKSLKNPTENPVSSFIENPKMGLSVENITKNISSAEKGTLRDFTDWVNGSNKPTPKELIELKKDAQDIASKYGFSSAMKGDKALANQIGEYLDSINYDKKITK